MSGESLGPHAARCRASDVAAWPMLALCWLAALPGWLLALPSLATSLPLSAPAFAALLPALCLRHPLHRVPCAAAHAPCQPGAVRRPPLLRLLPPAAQGALCLLRVASQWCPSALRRAESVLRCRCDGHARWQQAQGVLPRFWLPHLALSAAGLLHRSLSTPGALIPSTTQAITRGGAMRVGGLGHRVGRDRAGQGMIRLEATGKGIMG